jgi:hypothetical protein
MESRLDDGVIVRLGPRKTWLRGTNGRVVRVEPGTRIQPTDDDVLMLDTRCFGCLGWVVHRGYRPTVALFKSPTLGRYAFEECGHDDMCTQCAWNLTQQPLYPVCPRCGVSVRPSERPDRARHFALLDLNSKRLGRARSVSLSPTGTRNNEGVGLGMGSGSCRR